MKRRQGYRKARPLFEKHSRERDREMHPLAEVKQEPFEDKNWASAAENGEGLASQQTEDCSRHCCA